MNAIQMIGFTALAIVIIALAFVSYNQQLIIDSNHLLQSEKKALANQNKQLETENQKLAQKMSEANQNISYFQKQKQSITSNLKDLNKAVYEIFYLALSCQNAVFCQDRQGCSFSVEDYEYYCLYPLPSELESDYLQQLNSLVTIE